MIARSAAVKARTVAVFLVFHIIGHAIGLGGSVAQRTEKRGFSADLTEPADRICLRPRYRSRFIALQRAHRMAHIDTFECFIRLIKPLQRDEKMPDTENAPR